MFPFVDAFFRRIESVYHDRPYFIGLRARLLATFDLLVLGFVPFNVVKLLWLQPPEIFFRLAFNFDFGLAAFCSFLLVRRGHLEFAGLALVLLAVPPVHALAYLAPAYAEPVGVAMQMFVFDLVFLLLAIVFTTRRVALGILLFIVASHVAFYIVAFPPGPIAGSLRFAADIMLRDGLITMGFVFCLGVTLVTMIEGAHRRSEQALEETRAMNENLGRLVAERTEELEAATRRATDASRAKGDFLANMSHEIRTPLNGIVASSELLVARTDLSPEAAENARVIAESGEMLLRLIGDVLDFSKIEAGLFELENRAFPVAAMVEDCLRLMAAKAAEGRVRLECVLAPGLPAALEGDGFRLRQILLNLISNGIKFTPPGGLVRLSLGAAGVGPEMVRFEVRDTGIGMDAAAKEKLFQRFAQAESSTSRRYGGTGLGLSISFLLAELMGGRLEVESTPGQGSTFHFTLPLRAVDSVIDLIPAPDRDLKPIGLRVLIAEDNSVNRRILMAQLEKLGCRSMATADGAEALAALQCEPLPDAVLMDCDMPGVDGWEATRRLRSWANEPTATSTQRRASGLPVIALTAATLPEERARCFDAGMTDYLTKPLKLANLGRVLILIRDYAETLPSTVSATPVAGKSVGDGSDPVGKA